MKKFTFLKSTMIQTTLVACILLLASCGNNQKPEDSKVVAEERNEDKFDNNKQEKDAQFLVNAAEINLELIQLGQLAQQKGNSVHVKELGKMMEDSYINLQKHLTELANSKMISIPASPTNDAKDTYTELNNKSGNDFDKAYGDMMVNRHKDAIADFEKATTDSNDTDIKNWAIATLPDLRKHLIHSIECQTKSNKK